MFTKIEHFDKNFEHECDATYRVMSALTNASLSQAVIPGHRTLGRMAWHLVTTYPEMLNQIGLNLRSVSKDAPVPDSASDIANSYKAVSDELRNTVKATWTDATLAITDNMYGEEWTRGTTLLILLKHEAHHRGQMTVLMRQAGLVVPDIYGPAKEGWVNYGATPPEI